VKRTYFPEQELTTLLAEEQSIAKRLHSVAYQPPGMSLEEAKRETQQLRIVNLGEDGQDPALSPLRCSEVGLF